MEDDSTVGWEIETSTLPTSSTITPQITTKIGTIDVIVIVAYLCITVGIGLWATCSARSRNTISGYFLAERKAPWWAVGASLFASNIGTVHFIGLAGTGAASGIAVSAYEWLAAFLLLMLGWWYLPVYLASGVYTMPEYISMRYGGQRLRVMLTIISLFMYIFTKIAVDLYAGALFIQQVIDINLYLAIICLLLITAVYTIFGGLKAVIYTDTFQTVVMIIGGIILMVLGFQAIGGYDQLQEKYVASIPESGGANNTTCGTPREDFYKMFRHPVHSDLPWPGMLLAMMTMGSWYWCCDQIIVQRSLAAHTLEGAKGGCIFAGFLKLSPMFIMVMPGMISRILFPDEVACATPEACQEICQNPEGCWNLAYPLLVMEVMPTGLRGIMVASMLSALMSSLTSTFNSTSTIFTIDVWKRVRKEASEREMLIVGKITVVIMIVISILWIPILLSSAGGQLFIYVNMVICAIGPPIFSLYIYGIAWPKINEKGAFWGLLVGFTVGLTRIVLDLYFKPPACGQPEYRPPFIYKIHYLYVAPMVFVITSAVMIIVSYYTKPTNTQLGGLTWQTIHQRRTFNETTPSPSTKEENVIFKIEEANQPTEDDFSYKRKKFLLNLAAMIMIVVLSFMMGQYS